MSASEVRIASMQRVKLVPPLTQMLKLITLTFVTAPSAKQHAGATRRSNNRKSQFDMGLSLKKSRNGTRSEPKSIVRGVRMAYGNLNDGRHAVRLGNCPDPRGRRDTLCGASRVSVGGLAL